MVRKRRESLSVDSHALARFRERWPECAHMDVGEIAERITEQMAARKREGDVVQTPGGLYYPISFLGRDGYAVFNDNHISTILPEEYCPEVNNIRKK